MWRYIREMNRIKESIAGWDYKNNNFSIPYYIRNNENAAPEKSIEYTTDKQPKTEYPDEIFKTSAGEIKLYDEGEFGGKLEIGGKTICSGNFSKIFMYNGEKFVIDDLRHMCSYRFRLIKINDDGTVEEMYNAEENMSPNLECSVGLDDYYIGKDVTGAESVFFLCSGLIFDLSKKGIERYSDVQYLLIFNLNNKNNPFIRIDLPTKIEFSDVTSIWSDGMMLVIGCDKEAVLVYLPEMEVEYWTELGENEVAEILEGKKKL
jgi:hypothetical protein